MDFPQTIRLAARRAQYGCCIAFIALLAGLMSPPRAAAFARRPAAQAHPSATVEGSVRNSSGAPVAGANVVIERSGETRPLETKTNPDGTFTCSLPSAGTYTVRAEKAGVGRGVSAPLAVALGEKKRVVLILSGLGAEGAAPSNAKAGVNSAAATPEFEDTPDFTVAGVSGWSNLGLHGSQANARTSETLANETLALKSSGPDGTTPGSGNEAKGPAGRRESENELRTAVAQTPESFEANHRLGAYYLESRNYSEAIPLLETANRIDPGNSVNADDLVTAYINSGELAKAKDKIEKMLAETNTADLHRRLGDAEEQSGDSLGAVHEYETAVRLDPSEENYFAWGTELLLHRADQPAVEVFTKGSKAYPNSARMLAGLGAALYAGDAYEAGARRLCEASDLEPAESAPYIFLGEMEIAASAPLPCSEPRLERFVQKQPENALANYYYATALLKRVRGSENLANTKEAETLLKRAVTIDPKLGAAFLELGSLYAGRNEFSQAIGAYQKAVEASPDLADAYYQLGVTYRRTGEEAKSHREFQAYEQAEKKKAAADEQRRGELRQFLIVLQKPTTATDSR